MVKRKFRLPETEEGAVLFNTDPIILKSHYEMDYIHSYAQDSPFFAGLASGRLLGSRCTRCSKLYGTPRAHCMDDGAKTEWEELPLKGKVHSYTTCFYGGQEFLEETPYTLVLVEFDTADTLFLSRLVGAGDSQVEIGTEIEARFRRNSRFNITDVYFVPVDG